MYPTFPAGSNLEKRKREGEEEHAGKGKRFCADGGELTTVLDQPEKRGRGREGGKGGNTQGKEKGGVKGF